MKYQISALACTMVASLVLGCNSSVGGAGGDGGGGGAGGSGGESIPASCAVVTDQEGPFPVSFQFTVAAEGSTLYIDEDCVPFVKIFTCDDGYQTPVAIDDNCTADCTTEPNICKNCGQCGGGPPAISSSAPHEFTWAGHLYDFAQNQASCSCHETRDAHSGKYRITVPVYPTLADANAHTNGVDRTVDFDLPAPNGVVNVQLDAQ